MLHKIKGMCEVMRFKPIKQIDRCDGAMQKMEPSKTYNGKISGNIIQQNPGDGPLHKSKDEHSQKD